jgi:potassium-dependent mechanosensitive channel
LHPGKIALKKIICILCFIGFLLSINTVYAQSTSKSLPEQVIENVADQLLLLDDHKPLWTYDYLTEIHAPLSYNVTRLKRLSGLEFIKKQHKVPPAIFSLFLSFLLTYLLHGFTSTKFKNKSSTIHCKLKPISASFLLFFPSLILTILFSIIFKNAPSKPLLLSFTQILAAYFFILSIIRINVNFVLSNIKKTKKLHFKKILKHLTILILILLLGKLGHLVFQDQHLPSFIINIAAMLYLIPLYFHLFTIIANALNMRSSHQKKINKLDSAIKLIVIFIFFKIILKALSGSYETVIFLTQNAIQSLLLLMCVIEGVYFLWIFNNILTNSSHPMSIAVHKRMGLSPNKKLLEFSILCVLLTFASIRILGVGFKTIWNIPSSIADAGINFVRMKIYLFNIHINIPGIARGLILFCFILILGRLVGVFLTKKTHLQNKNKNKNKNQTQVAIITLTNYAAFSLGVLTLLLNAGVNLSGFAMVASALSVGIGFGLKNLAADLIAGLILLLSKPLRPGDHIKVEANEGFIQKINLLSTVIKTVKESDVIVPNGALLSKSVTNYTYANKFLGITSDIIIQDTTDVKRAKNILLDVAKTHPELHQRGNKKPFVTVDLSAEKTLNIILTLHCTVKDVNNELLIKSSINSDIIVALKKHKIALKT